MQRLDPGPRYSEMALHRGVAYLAGQVPDDEQADMAGQTRQVLQAIDRLLQRVGSDRGRLLMCTIYLADLADYAVLNEVWDAWLDGQPAPPRATVQAALAQPGWKLEIVATAALPDEG
jgi:enamine deaminase RidA (YjgF/YER057c/UK114 family)